MLLRTTLVAALAAALTLPAGAPARSDRDGAGQEVPFRPLPAPTEVRDAAMLERLRGNSGVTLQWISWDHRGRLAVTETNGVVHLSGGQIAADGRGELAIDGDVVAIDGDSFTFRGEISIANTPDLTRNCLRDGVYEFRLTQNRRYWRLQEMEVCDRLTDYVDIYF